MKKLLFLTNISRGVTTVSIPMIKACDNLNIEYHESANMDNFTDNPKYPIIKHDVQMNRNPLSLYNIKIFFELKKIISDENIDYIHCNTPIGGILGRLLGLRCGSVKKVIYTAHGFHFFKGNSKIKNWIFRTIESVLALMTDAIITINEEDFIAAKKMKLKKDGKVYFVPGVGVDIIETENLLKQASLTKEQLGLTDEFTIVMAGDLIKRKNFITALEAVNILKKENIKFLICGEGPEEETLKKYVYEKELSSQVEFLGFRKDVLEVISLADIFIFPSYQEGLPRVLMEAMILSKPCIASKIRGNEDLIMDQEGGYLIEPNDFKSLSERILVYINNSEQKIKDGKFNRNFVEKFDITVIEKEINLIYKELL